MTASSKRNLKEKPIHRKEEKPEEPELQKYRDRAKERREDQNPDYERSELGFHAVAPPGSVDILSSIAHKLSIEKSKYLGANRIRLQFHFETYFTDVAFLLFEVWSNGKLKKVRGRPVANLGDENDSRCITMSMLITLPTESNVAPLLPKATIGSGNKDKIEEDEEENNIGGEGQERVFNSFDFEDYAWRVYHERLLFNDPLGRYRVTKMLELPH